MLMIHISSGNGVDEVCRALYHFLQWLEGRYTFEVVTLEYAHCEDGYKSIVLKSEDERFVALEGTHLWRCQSPFRPKHKRKNWYFSLTIFEEYIPVSIEEKRVVYQTMKSPKKGGQHVNTTCSGVRAIYAPLGIEAISYDEQSQHQNRKKALARLKQKSQQLAQQKVLEHKNQQYREGKQVVRGNAVMVFEGEGFGLVVSKMTHH